MLEFLGSIASSILGGGVTGILGVVVQRVADYKNKQLDLQASRERSAHELAMRKADAEIMAQEWASRTKVAEVEAAGRESVADSEAFAASFNEPIRYTEGIKLSGPQGWLMVILEFVRGMVRPSLTIYLCAVTTLIYLHARSLIGAGGPMLSPEQALDLIKMIVGTVLYLTTTCVLWWFGTRNKQKAPQVKG